MHRRSHRKSRNGCRECKRRHIKCDENRPNCTNCQTAQLCCSYSTKTPDHGNFIPFDNSHKSSSSPTSTNTSQPLLVPGPYVNLLHLELFNHVANDEDAFIITDATTRTQRPRILKLAFTWPFLLYELLACSSMHCSLTHPDISKHQMYRDEASRLQAEGLTSFNDTVKEITDDNVIPAFLFSGILGLHSFSDVFSMPGQDLDAFLDRLVHSIRLLRGVQTVLSGKWELILKSDIGPLVQPGEPLFDTDDVVLGLEKLRGRLSDLWGVDTTQVQVCDKAMDQMCWVYRSNLGTSIPDGRASPRMVTSWPVMVSTEFTELVDKRNPRALIVLAHFSVLLHRCRNVWAVGSAGTTLLNALGIYLGSEWEDWLAWPRTMVYGTGD
ncbi:uncharacterized protein LY89DRAFT_52681 [Mollisia scopiformis]|uniref:Zn(2)-C6 fungal-type domain-containing protein n=1 Tax=Mollisia scopiformis TaxID=149040 RepID=A0A194XB40_MOLSC|nr:uncharacterized protein LY89DRAFT_52681 [Mollisia scopiformis]KUJ17390.1 hypothetical protein LY89DRAFT_52681 [Mollisia scopiformis]